MNQRRRFRAKRRRASRRAILILISRVPRHAHGLVDDGGAELTRQQWEAL